MNERIKFVNSVMLRVDTTHLQLRSSDNSRDDEGTR